MFQTGQNPRFFRTIQNFDRDVTAQFSVFGGVDYAHPSTADFFDEAIAGAAKVRQISRYFQSREHPVRDHFRRARASR
jgi:hypothetical protein